MMTAETKTQKWISEAGPIQTKRVNKAIQALTWRGKTSVRLMGVVGGEERRYESTSPFSAPSAECSAALAAIGEKYGWSITRENHAAIVADLESATRALVLSVVDERQTQDDMAEIARERAEREQKSAEESRQRAADKVRIVAELRQQYPWAKPEGALSSWARAAANLREELSRTFPGVKFSVTSESYSMGNSVNYSWQLGPTSKQVEAVAGKYQAGNFDGMQDMYEDDNSAYGSAIEDVLGRAKYCHGSRGVPEDVRETVGRALCEVQHVEYAGGQTRNVFGQNDDRYLSDHVHTMIAEAAFPIGATITGIEDNPESGLQPYKIVFATPAVVVANESPVVSGAFRIEKHHHTKRGFDMWLVILADRVDRDQFESLRASCETADGWYSRQWGKTPGGFAFKSESAANQWAQSSVAGACPEPSSVAMSAAIAKPASPGIVERLREMADSMQKTIEDKTRPLSQNWTPKRGREYDSRRHDGENLRRGQFALRALADAHEAGTVPAILAGIRTKKEACELTATSCDTSGGYYSYVDTGRPRDTSAKGEVLRALVESSKTGADKEAELAKKRAAHVDAQINELRRCDIPGFFPTPPAVAQQVIDAAGIESSHRVLEPSAGIGSLAELCPNIGNVDCVEQWNSLAEILSCKGFAVINRDFLTEDPTVIYDRIVMNPPFENSQDIAHIQHAFRFLKTGGRLAAICSSGPFFRSDRGSIEFREWLASLDASIEELPADAFNGSDAFRRTGVACKLIVIDKRG